MAQQYAQMWKRNGYALIHQVYYYHNIKSGTEMFDRDVLMLQVIHLISYISSILFKIGFFLPSVEAGNKQVEIA